MHFGHLMRMFGILCFHILVTTCMNSKQPDSKAENNKLHIYEIIGSILNDIQVYATGFLARPLNSDTNTHPVEINPHILPTPNLPGTTSNSGQRFAWYEHCVFLHVGSRPFSVTASFFQCTPTINDDNNGRNEAGDSTSRTNANLNDNTDRRFNRRQEATLRVETVEVNRKIERVTSSPGRNNIRENHSKNDVSVYKPSEEDEPSHLSHDGECPKKPNSTKTATLTEETRFIASGRGEETVTLTEDLFDPSMVEEETRIETFAQWPHGFLSPAHMARAGFYFTNSGDMVRCFYCGRYLEEWQPADDPIDEHRRLSPECEYIQMLDDQGNDICPRALQSKSVKQPAKMQPENDVCSAQICSANNTKVNVVTSRSKVANNRVRQQKRKTPDSWLVSATDVGQPVTFSRTDIVENILESQDAAIVLREGYSRAQVAQAAHSLIDGNGNLEFELTHELLRGTLLSMGIRPRRRPNLVDEELSNEDTSNF